MPKKPHIKMNISWGNLNKIGGLHQLQYLGFDIIPKF